MNKHADIFLLDLSQRNAHLLFCERHGKTLPDGSVVVQVTTNGNADLPTPGPVEYFLHHYANEREARMGIGRSGTGVYGGRITVTLDGKRVVRMPVTPDGIPQDTNDEEL